MMRNLILVLAAAAAAAGGPALAQEDGDGKPPVGAWQSEYKVALNVLQSSYSENWNGGDKGSVVWNGSFDGRLEKRYGESSDWRNTLRLSYGQTHQQERTDAGELYWRKPDKTDDLIEFESLFRWTTASGWDPYASLRFESKFEDRNDPAGRSIAFNPMVITPAAGMSRALIDTGKRRLLARVGVAYVLNNRAFFTAPAPATGTSREWSEELAAEAVLEYRVGALDERVDWESTLTVMKPFVYSGKDAFTDDIDPAAYGLPADVGDYTLVPDVDWQNTFTAAVTRVISVKLFVRWVYDKYDNTVAPVVDGGTLTNADAVAVAIRKAGQFKQTLALSFGYTF